VQVRLAAAAAITRAGDATRSAGRALAQVAVGPDPLPARRSPWQRRAAVGLAVAVAAATAAPLVGKIVKHDVPGSLHGIVIPELYFQRIAPVWLVALLVLAALAGVLPLPMAMLSRSLLGWRLGWLALLAAPWTQARWLWFNRNFSWEPVQVAVLTVVFIAAGIRNRRGVLWWMWALTVLGWWLSTLAWWLQADGAKPGLALPAGTIFLTAAAVAADVLGDRDRARLALADATERAESETARRAVLEERAKIARELHDAVAHHLSLIAVRADAAPYRLAGLASEARAEFSDLGETAREAMTEMRRLLGVLRTGQPVPRRRARPAAAIRRPARTGRRRPRRRADRRTRPARTGQHAARDSGQLRVPDRPGVAIQRGTARPRCRDQRRRRGGTLHRSAENQ
jgi:hypothetical protein